MLPRMADADDFRLEEYRALRKEIDEHMSETRTEERYAIISAGVTWGWLIGNHKTNGLLWSVPVFLTLAIVLRTYAMSDHIVEIGRYLRTTETSFGIKGWEHTIKLRHVTRVNKYVTAGLLVLAAVAWGMRFTLAR